MENRTLGLTGLSVSVLGLGASEVGFEGSSPADVQRIVDAAIDSGITLIDTAAAYLSSEEMLGEALAGKRQSVTLVTKCGAYDGFKKEDWSREGILSHVQQSLRALQTDYVDVLLLHSCGLDDLKRGESIEGLEAARQSGLTRFIGYSGDSAAAKWAAESGLFDVLECSVNIADQEVLDFVLPKAVEKSMGVIAKRPIANAAWRYTEKPTNSYHTEYWKRLQELDYGFGEDFADVALRFTLSQPGVTTAIVGTTKAERIEQNAAIALRGELEPEKIRFIRERWADQAERGWTGQT